MILNIVIIVAVLALAMFWSTQGLFSAFIHLVATVAAGAIALAVWEPFTLGFLFGAIPKWSWAAGLLLPFAAALFVLRLLSNKFVGGNLKMPDLVDQIGGGLVGAVSGFLTAGVCLLGVSFLPLGAALIGYQPVAVESTGRIGVPTDDSVTSSLWLPVDRAAAGFFSFASTHGFASKRPLGLLRPDLARQAGMYRTGQIYDENASLVANPSTVSVESVLVFDDALPSEVPGLIERFVRERAATRDGDRLVLVTTQWENLEDTSTFDEGILRLPPVQALLLATQGDRPVVRHLPVGWSKRPATSAGSKFYGVVDNRSYASSEVANDKITFVYAIPASETPVFFETRMLRIPLPEQSEATGAAVAELLGTPAIDAAEEAAADDAASGGSRAPRRRGAEPVGEPQGNSVLRALSIELSDQLPARISINAASGLDVEETVVISGEQRVPAGDRTAGVTSIRTPPDLIMVRLELVPWSTSQALPSRLARPVTGGDGRYKLVDAFGQDYFARAVVWREDSGEQNIRVEDRLDNVNELPINKMGPEDDLFVYFAVPDGVRLEKFVAGLMEQSVDFEATPRR